MTTLDAARPVLLSSSLPPHAHHSPVFQSSDLSTVLLSGYPIRSVLRSQVFSAGAAAAYRSIGATSIKHISIPWEPATATWYGSPHGAGSDGGACGYGGLAGTPYGSSITAASLVLFRNGKGCGSCYQVRCVGSWLCSTHAVTVVVTDECPPGGYCAYGRTHFDLSGTAFGEMANYGRGSELLNMGVMQIQYRRVNCAYPRGVPLEFHVSPGASPYWFSILVKYVAGPGDLGSVELLQAGSKFWQPMTQVWGVNWCHYGGPIKAPFSLRLTSLSSRRTITAYDVIPRNWYAGGVYRTNINF
ncbi:hypothetical protein O6H91_01G081400 [Diphasiastrum complanatum]|uniref:Uncharacterized protein n=1 Tax=Diphasiastrum complanatum TaxID=34168 RepID=A0ACC2ESE8_DIPCM|nr:hypothetical protein O6H91_01G081400 [Diphasiastrum complanatum]